MPEVHVLTVSTGLPVRLLEALLTQTEAVLEDQGATRIWIDSSLPGTTVLAELPTDGPADLPDGEPVDEAEADERHLDRHRDVVGIAGSAGDAWQNGRRGS